MISLDLGYPPVPARITSKDGTVVAEILVGYPLPAALEIPTVEESPSLRYHGDDEPISYNRPRFGTRSFLRVGRVGRVIQYLE